MRNKKIIMICLLINIIIFLNKDSLFANDPEEKSENVSFKISYFLGGSFMYPRQDFSDLVKNGYGASAGIIFHDLVFNSSALLFSGGLHKYKAERENVDSFYQYNGGAFLGYTFMRENDFQITPFIGGGFFFHKMKNTVNDETESNLYRDPYAGIKLDCVYYFTKNISLRLTPGYNVFFEKDGNKGHIISTDVAIGFTHSIAGGSDVGTGITRQETKNKIILSTAGIVFAPSKSYLVRNNREQKKLNTQLLNQLAEEIKKYPNYNIIILGHAVNLFWDDEKKAKQDEVSNLLPLSKARAELIKWEIFKRGIKRKRISTKGMGGSKPLFPFSEVENRWKNRRVEVILIKK